MATQVVRNRVDSSERWEAALRRALDAGLEVFVVADTGERMVTSASRLDMLHRTDGYRCTCEAALAGDPCCQHRAVVRFVLGWFDAPTTRVACPSCRNRGWEPKAAGDARSWIPEDERQPCRRCHGCGSVSVSMHPLGRPVELVAD